MRFNKIKRMVENPDTVKNNFKQEIKTRLEKLFLFMNIEKDLIK